MSDVKVAEKAVWQCSLTDGYVEPCTALSEVLQPQSRGSRSQGLELHSLIDINTFKHSRHIAVLKSGAHGKKGLVLNFCPFCRGELLAGSTRALKRKLASPSPSTGRR